MACCPIRCVDILVWLGTPAALDDSLILSSICSERTTVFSPLYIFSGIQKQGFFTSFWVSKCFSQINFYFQAFFGFLYVCSVLLLYRISVVQLIQSAFVLHGITKTRLFKYIENLTTKKWKFSDKFFWYFSYFCSKHRLWVLVRTASPRRF